MLGIYVVLGQDEHHNQQLQGTKVCTVDMKEANETFTIP